jgi:hypothetical protein
LRLGTAELVADRLKSIVGGVDLPDGAVAGAAQMAQAEAATVWVLLFHAPIVAQRGVNLD